MNKQKTLVFFGAHPDDESFGIGSTLAQYAASGVRVYYVCSTGGESGTVDPKYLKGNTSIKQLRSAEMRCAAEVLGLAGVYDLGYRDSGMRGSESKREAPLTTEENGGDQDGRPPTRQPAIRIREAAGERLAGVSPPVYLSGPG